VAVSLKPIIKMVFPFTECEICHHVLGYVSKNDGIVQNQIANHLATADRRDVRKALALLVSKGFLVYKQSKKSRRNIRNAFGKGISVQPKYYHLTFKGFLTSLAEANLGDNYLMQKYLRLFPNSLKNDVLEYIRIEIFLYVSYNGVLGITLTNVTDVVFHIDDTSYRWHDVGLGERASYFVDLEEKQANLLDKIKENKDLIPLLDDWAKALNLLSYDTNKKIIIDQLEKDSLDYLLKTSSKTLEKNIKDWGADVGLS